MKTRDGQRDANDGGVRVLHKTLDILEILNADRGGIRLADLARHVEFPKPTVHRILATLETRGYLDRSQNGGYRVSKKFFEMRREEPLEQLLVRAAQPLIEKLAAVCKETINLGVLDAGEVVVIHTVESAQAVRMSSKVGNRRYIHSTALGKVMLAAMPERDALRLLKLKGTPRVTATTLVTRTAVMAELEKVRAQGYALDNQENEIEGRCIGAPIYGPSQGSERGEVIAALSISSPEFRMDLARAHALSRKLRETCAAISKGLAR